MFIAIAVFIHLGSLNFNFYIFSTTNAAKDVTKIHNTFDFVTNETNYSFLQSIFCMEAPVTWVISRPLKHGY